MGGLGLLVSTFLNWYTVDGVSLTAWQAFSVIDILLAAAAVAALSVATVVVLRLSVSYPAAGSAVSTLFGFIAVVLVAYRLIDPPGGGTVTLCAGAWIGLGSAVLILLGGYLGMQEPSAI